MNQARVFGLFVWALREIVSSALVLLGASFLLFTVARLAPGNRAESLSWLTRAPVGSASTPSGAEAETFVLLQYGRWLGGAIRGEFGSSATLQRGRPVSELLIPAAARSLGLALAGLALSTLSALVLAALRGLRPHSRLAGLVTEVAHLVSTLPVFLFVYAAVAGGNRILSWGAHEGLWAVPSWFPFPSQIHWIPWAVAAWILALGDGLLADLYHRFRSELAHASEGEYLVGVRLLRLSVPMAIVRGFLPGATSHLSRRIGFVLGSMVVLEAALGWPGLGYLAWRAAAERDLPVLLGVALVLAVVVRLAVMAAQGLWCAADPRNRAVG